MAKGQQNLGMRELKTLKQSQTTPGGDPCFRSLNKLGGLVGRAQDHTPQVLYLEGQKGPKSEVLDK